LRKIALIGNQASSLINFRGDLVRHLARLGCVVYAFAPDYSEEHKLKVRELGGVPVDFYLSRSGANPFSDLIGAFKIYLLLRDISPDIAFSYFIKPAIYGSLASWLAGVPRRFAMIEGLGFVFTDDGRRLGVKRGFLRSVVMALFYVSLKRCNRVFFLNNDDRSFFVERNLVDDSKAICIGGIGVCLNYWRDDRLPRSNSQIRFAFVGRLLKEKGVYDFVQAAKIVKQVFPEASFLLLGALDENPGSISFEEVDGWVKAGLVEWPGHVSVKDWLLGSSVFVLPSYREGVPRSTQEAMALGLPVITTDVPGCRDTVIDGENGFLVKVRRPDEIASRMIRFIKDPSLVDSMGKASRCRAEKIYDVEVVNARLSSLLLNS
jgi:glycosyltransferase involved in cell wall biosynthesis